MGLAQQLVLIPRFPAFRLRSPSKVRQRRLRDPTFPPRVADGLFLGGSASTSMGFKDEPSGGEIPSMPPNISMSIGLKKDEPGDAEPLLSGSRARGLGSSQTLQRARCQVRQALSHCETVVQAHAYCQALP